MSGVEILQCDKNITCADLLDLKSRVYELNSTISSTNETLVIVGILVFVVGILCGLILTDKKLMKFLNNEK